MNRTDQPSNASPVSEAAKLFEGYNGGKEMPLAGYAGLVGIYNAAFAALLVAARRAGKELPARTSYADLVLLGLATHKLSLIISKDRVTSPLRAPFTEYVEPDGTNEVKERVRGEGVQRAIGDLLICQYCLSPWVAAALAFGFVFKPKTTRFIGGILVAATVSDLAHHAYERIKKSQ